MDIFFVDWLGKPVWIWASFLGLVLALLAFDLGLLSRRNEAIGVRKSLMLSSFYLTLGVGYGAWVWWYLGQQSGVEYLTGFAVEKSLAVDNVFVIATIFAYLAIPAQYQHRVLFWGILGVMLLRAVMIGFGAALVSEFGWVLYIFALFLVFTGVKMWLTADKEIDLSQSRGLAWLRRRMRVTDGLRDQKFFVRQPHPKTGRPALWATPLFLALVLVEIADIVFAVDSVPAIFAITTDPFIVYTSNIFAILGLRALYFALAAMLHRFAYLKQALAALLVFIGAKIFIADLLGLEKFPAGLSLGITAAILLAGIGWSLWKTRNTPPLGAAPLLKGRSAGHEPAAPERSG